MIRQPAQVAWMVVEAQLRLSLTFRPLQMVPPARTGSPRVNHFNPNYVCLLVLLFLFKAIGLYADETPILTPSIKQTLPQDYDGPALMEALSKRLAPADLSMVVNPLANTQEMREWARQLTSGATNDVQKAISLFKTLAARACKDKRILTQPLSAAEVFSNWNNEGVSFVCSDYAFLYVSLARAVGLKAYAVDVQEACDGSKMWHACAAVYFGTNAVLVDPIYGWFGGTHRKFFILDDIAVVADFLTAHDDLKQRQIAVKLAPGSVPASENLAVSMMNAGQWTAASNVLASVVKMDANDWVTDYLWARFALYYENKPNQAIDLLKKAADENPEAGSVYILAGAIHASKGEPATARDYFQRALHCVLKKRKSNRPPNP